MIGPGMTPSGEITQANAYVMLGCSLVSLAVSIWAVISAYRDDK